MSKHTPGEWKANKSIVQDNTGYCIAQTWPDTRLSSSESLMRMAANARLIAAVPELLEACTKAHDALLSLHVCNQDTSFAVEIRTLLRAAIRKATQ